MTKEERTLHHQGQTLTVEQLTKFLAQMPADAQVYLGQQASPGGPILGGSALVAVHYNKDTFKSDVWLMPDGD